MSALETYLTVWPSSKSDMETLHVASPKPCGLLSLLLLVLLARLFIAGYYQWINFRMAAQLSDAELIEVLDSTIGIFIMLNMNATIKQVRYIIDEVQRSSVIRSYLNALFTHLQYISERDFGTTPYKKDIIAYMNRRVALNMTTYIDEIAELTKQPPIVEMINDRVNAYKIIGTLKKILEPVAQSPNERMLGLSIAYANAIEGIYKRAVQDCYVWEKISIGSAGAGQVTTLPNQDIKTVITYYDKQNIDKCIFEGYDDIVRNAVAHSTLSFDQTTNEMLYIDRRSNRQT